MRGDQIGGAGLLAAALVAVAAGAVPVGDGSETTAPVDGAGVLALLEVIDAIAALHPGFEERAADLETMSDGDRTTSLADARARNESSAEVGDAIDRLFKTPAYRIYFRRFTNLTPEIVREALLDLPYVARPAPGATGDFFYQLVRERAQVRPLVAELLGEIDFDRVLALARHWAPDGADSEPPTFHLIYDGNAGSFTAEGKPFFNLYSEVNKARLRSADWEETLVAASEEIMAHELQHLLANPFLERAFLERADDEWRLAVVDAVTHGLVSEGVAFHCSPPVGFQRDLWEDDETTRALLQRLNTLLLSVRRPDFTLADARQWYVDNLDAFPGELLRSYLARTHEGDALDAEVAKRMVLRPDLDHALGWWMVSKISRVGQSAEDRGAVVGLLDRPYALYTLYDEAMSGGPAELRIDPHGLAFVEELSAHE